MKRFSRPRALAAGVRAREVWAWAMYDFANSGFTTVVITALFNAYFVAVVAGEAPWATFAWTAALAVSYALIIISAPLIGAYADQRAAKKRLLLIATVGCVGFTALLWFAQPGTVVFALVCVIAANFFFGSGGKPDRGLPARARPPARARARLRLGLEPRLSGRPRHPRRLPRLCRLERSAWPRRARLCAGQHVDHCGHLRAGKPADVPAA
jgi:hypothetical protein